MLYYNKIETIHNSISQELSLLDTQQCPYISHTPPSVLFSQFSPLSADDLSKLILEMNSKQSSTDPIPLPFVKQHLNVFLPIILKITNASLQQGVFPDDLKHADVSPIIKDKKLDSEVYGNFRPVSSLPFLSKVIEKVALSQFSDYLNENSLIPPDQSAYLPGHSCETALCKVVSDIQRMLSERKAVILVQLDLSAAFDTIDHAALILLLEQRFGVKGVALKFFKSYLSNRTYSVKIKHVKGGKVILVYGVPQGSILGPLLFILYIADLPALVAKHNISAHCYADDA